MVFAEESPSILCECKFGFRGLRLLLAMGEV